ncbi:Hypothetical protein SRAE_1000251200 [Strongyloides ratti]|uniref:Uncharacterized protein n=1 Tax=Strongyloides ratti TaxID=34506 RepID=A0A090L3I1_STRRB|nr:Hypothetical protein SRAE_1000251200 [Strongyloides ratti]CEF64257.1 Hypothetical protein SRAE_1000251200 [Strongyloides ratti]
MNNTKNQVQFNKSPNTKEISKKQPVILEKVVQSKQKTCSSEKSYDDTLRNVDELPDDDESIRNAIDPKK